MKISKKLLSLLLCAVMVLGSVAVGGEGFAEMLDAFSVKASASTTTPYYNWKQYDSQWGGNYIGTKTISKIGCAATSISMLIVHSGLRNESNFDPGTFVSSMKAVGGFSNNDIYWGKVSSAVSGFNYYTSYTFSSSATYSSKISKIKEYVDSGKYVVVAVQNYGHYVAVRSAATSKISIMDPNTSATDLSYYSNSGIVNLRVYSSSGGGYNGDNQYTEPSTTSTLSFNNYNYPSEIYSGNGFTISGTVSSNYNLEWVYAAINTADGTPLYKSSSSPYTKTFNIGNFDSALKFGSLGAGTYTYHVEATDVSGNFKVLLSKQFTVVNQVAAASTLNLSSLSSPSSINKGNSYSVSGTISSNYKIHWVYASILNSNGDTIYSTCAYPHAYSYNISNLNSGLYFNRLGTGTYYFYVEATDDSYNFQILAYKAFAVKELNNSPADGFEVWQVTTSAGLNQRSGAGTGYSVVQSIPTNAYVNISSKASANGYTWGYCVYNGKEGWVVLDYCAFSNYWPGIPVPTVSAGTNKKASAFSWNPTQYSEWYEIVIKDSSGNPSYYNTSGTSFSIVLSAGSYTAAVVAYCGSVYRYSDWVSFSVGNDTLSEVTLKSLPTKVTYTEGESFNGSGTTLTLKYASGVTESATPTSYTGYSSTPGNKTITAKYNSFSVTFNVTVLKKYYITYDANGGTGAPAKQTKIENSSVTISSNKPTRTGYSFLVWNTEPDGMGTSYNSGSQYRINEDIKLYAIWADETAPTINGSCTNNVAASQTLSASLSDISGISGYYFGTNNDFAKNEYTALENEPKEATFSKTITAAGTYYLTVLDLYGNSVNSYATFYKVTFNVNGGTVSPTNVIVFSGKSFVLPTPTRTGYTFNGWNTKSDGSGTSYAAGTTFNTTANVTLYAQWKDSAKPTCSIASTNNVASSQTATLTLKDNVGVVAYYWGTNSTYTSNTKTAISSVTSTNISKSITTAGTYYVTAIDSAGNVSSTASKTFFNTTLNTNGGTVSPANVITMSGNSVALPTPTRTGYSFKGWNTKSDGTGTSYAAGANYSATANVTLYAIWSVNTYTVSYNANGGTGAPANQTKTYGTDLTLSSTMPTRSVTITLNPQSGTVSPTSKTVSYIFKNWNTKADGSGTTYASGAKYSANAGATLYAQWTNPAAYALPTPTRTGYTFKGWNTKSDGTGTSYAAGANYSATANVTLYAIWEINKYTVAYNANGGTGAPVNQTKTYGTDLTLSSTMPTRSVTITLNPQSGTVSPTSKTVSYTFKNWNTKADGSGTTYASGAKYSANAGATLYAQWTSPAAYALPTPTRTGYTFKGWNTKSDGTGTSYAAGANYSATADVTLYAIWSINTYTVSYNANGGTGAPANQTKTYGTNLTLSSTKPTRTGYTFNGWNTAKDGTGTAYAAGAVYSKDAATTLYAQWKADTYTVTFNANGGTTPTASKSVTYGSIYGTLPAPTYTGYIFNGWFTASSGGTQVTADTTVSITAAQTLYAHWTAVTLSSVTVKTNPTKVNYYVGDSLATAGLTLTAKYSDNSTKTISSGFTCTPTTLNTAGNQTVTVSYGGKSTTFTVYVTAVALSGISVKTNPTKTSYYVGDSLNASGLTLTAAYNNGKTETVTSGFTCTPTALNTAGTQTITVTYNGKTASFNVTVSAVSLSSIAIKTAATKINYYVGDSVDTSGLTLTASYNNGTTKTISSGFTATADLSSTGTKTVTVSYGGKTVTFTVTVEPVPVLNHTITYKVDGNVYSKATYEEGEAIAKPTNPSKTGYIFKGWTPSVPETMQSSDITVEAVFELLSYNAVFMANGSTVATVPYNINTASISEPDVPSKTGYDGKWQAYTLIPGGITVNAVYTAKSYTVKWNINGETTTETYKYGEAINEPMVSVATGYEFKGWGASVPTTMPANNLTFTAAISPIAYTARFVANGQSIADVTYYVTTTSISEPDVPEKTGYTGKWQSYTLVPGGVTINAVYTINSYTVTWSINGIKTTENYKYGAVIEEPVVVPADGYEFTGWSAEIPDNMPAKAQSFTAKFTPITYFATFVADGKTVQKVAYTVEDDSVIEPNVPSKAGYTGSWQNYTLKLGGVTVGVVYTPIEYNAKFAADGKTVENIKYTIEDSYIIEPDVPEKAGYTGEWSEYELKVGGVTVNAVYTPIQFSATFIADGTQVTSIKYTVETPSITVPIVPEKAGYTGKWESYELGLGGVTVNAVYTPIEYSAKFVADGKTVDILKYTVEDNSIGEPSVPEKSGYDGTWDMYSLDIGGITVNAVYTESIYHAYFVADGNTIKAVDYTISTKSVDEPDVPEKTGYTGKWNDYSLELGGITVEANYTANTYSVKWLVDDTESSAEYRFDEEIIKPSNPKKEGYIFKGWSPSVPKAMPAENLDFYAVFEPKTFTVDIIVDGKKIGETSYTYGDTELDLSDYPVPEKEGYTGKWEYTLTADGATVIAVYTPISNSTANSKIFVAAEQKIDYRSKVIIKATATNVPEGYYLVMTVDGKEIKGNNTEVTYEISELSKDVTYSVKVVDKNGNVQKDNSGNELKKDGGKITVNAGFFKKLIAFFKKLFKSLPTITVKP